MLLVIIGKETEAQRCLTTHGYPSSERCSQDSNECRLAPEPERYYQEPWWDAELKSWALLTSNLRHMSKR